MVVSSPIPPTLGKRIAECREHLGWTQKTLADKANLSVTFVSEVENDRRTPGADALLRLAEALGVSLDYLVKGLPETAPHPRPLVIPPTLAQAADEGGWSVGEVSDLLKFRHMVVARRSRGGEVDSPDDSLSKNDWRALYKRFYGSDHHGEARS
jgi:transcriptional regulator with XRE-family HTH domain